MKNIKNLKMKILSVLMLIAIFTLELSPFSVKGAANQLQYYSPGAVSVGYDSFNDKNVWYSNATLGGITAYCIDYTCPAPSGVMTYSRRLSDQGLAILLHGYPNSSPASLGCESADEAYMATQMALWEVLNRTQESQKSGRPFRVNNVTPIASKQGFFTRATAAAQRLVSIAQTDPYTDHPTLTIDASQAKLSSVGANALIGPYSATVTGVADQGCIKGITASLTNAPASAVIVDENGNQKTSVANGEKVYVRFSAQEETRSFKINFTADVDKKVGKIYTTGGNVQDYVILDTEPTQVPGSVDINWTKVETAGQIKLVKVDQDDQPVVGAVFALKDAQGNELIEAATGKDGIITFTNVPEGNYVLAELSAPAGYVIKEQTKNVTVVRKQTTEVKVVNDRITGKLVITKIDDLNRPLANVSFNIYDADGYYVDCIITDAEGKASIDVNYGTYYFKEVSAPQGYIMDETLYKFTVDAENRTFYKTITNEIFKGSIIITKVDDANQPIKDVVFDITDAQGNLVNTLTTSESGKCGLKNLPIGTYYYQEKSVPAGYKMDPEKHEFKLTQNNEVIQATVVNEKITGKLQITKVDDSNKAIAGVVFNVLDADGNVVDTLTTDANGKAESIELNLGTYYYQEVSVPDTYIMDPAKHEFTLTEEVTLVAKTVVNEQMKGSLQITKYTNKGTTLSGVVFNILDKDGNVVDTLTTDAQGKATSKELVIGTYFYKEVSAPENVVMDTEAHEFVINTNNQVVTKSVVNNIAEGKLKIIKVDENNKPVEGVVFNIMDKDGNVIDTMTTNAQGIAESKEIEKGTYYYQEISAPAGLMVDNKVYEFTIEYDGQNVIRNMINYYAKGNLQIVKYTNKNKTLANVVFEITDANGKVVDTLTTDAEGKASSKNLPMGTYYYQEISAPDSVVMDTAKHTFVLEKNNQVITEKVINKVQEGKLKIIKVDENDKPLQGVKFNIITLDGEIIDTIVTDENGVAESKEIEKGTYYYQEIEAPEGIIVDNNKYEFTIEYDGQNVIAEMVNYYCKGQLEITKYTDNNRVLAGVVFNILDKDGKVVDTITTDAEGKAISERLPLGTYSYVEVSAPDTVVMDTEAHEFVLETNNQVVSKEVYNKTLTGKLTIIKVDENEKPLQGVKFDIITLDGEVIDTIVTDENGVAKSKEIEKGTYYYQEIEAPEGIIVDSTKYEFTIEYDGQNVIANMVNYYAKGQLEITKYTNKGNTLEGVVFNILDKDGKVVDTITTGKDGKATSERLPLGTYTYVEVSAPENVVMDTEAHEFVINTNNQVVTKSVINKVIEGKLKIIKQDENEKPLQGVKFNIITLDGKVIDTIVTDENGRAESKEIEKGTYYYQEIEAPAGIVVDNNKYEFTIEYDGQNVIAEMVNYYAKGQIEIVKLDSKTSATLAGAEFTITDMDGNKVCVLTTDANGYAISEELLLGTYYYKETKAPIDYKIDNNVYKVTITENGEIVRVVAYNEKDFLPVTGGLLGTDAQIVVVVSLVAFLGYALSTALRKREEY